MKITYTIFAPICMFVGILFFSCAATYIFGSWSGSGIASDSSLWKKALIANGVMEEKVASDHRPLFIEFNLEFLLTKGR